MPPARAPLARPDYESAFLAGGAVTVATAAAGIAALARVFDVPATALVKAIPHIHMLPIAEALALGGVIGLAATAGAMIGASIASRKIEPTVHGSGGQLREGATAARAAINREARMSPVLFNVAGIDWTLDRIRRSVVALGSISGGKTQVLWNLINGLRGAGFRLLVVDGPKGDYSECMPGKPLIISPWHAGPAWDIARDCPTRGHARELAKSLIPVSEKDPLWGNAAGMIFTAILCKLQVEKPEKWGWTDIYEHITLSTDELKEIAAEYYPPAVQAVADAESKTTQSIMINLTVFMSDVYEMALAWRDTEQKFSFTVWWQGRYKNGPQVVILQGSGEFKSLAGGYISAIVNTLANLTASPSFPESKSRKNCIIIDEMAQLPRLAGVEKFLEIGRSKGCSAIFATQSPAQLRKIYGQDDLSSWLAMVGTKCFVRIVGADDSEVALREIGEKEVFYRMQSSTSGGSAAGASGASNSATTSWQREKIGVVRQDELQDLGPCDDKGIRGIRVILSGFGKDPIRVVFPFVNTKKLRPAIIENPRFNTHDIHTAESKPETPADAGDDATEVAAPQIQILSEAVNAPHPPPTPTEEILDLDDLMMNSEPAGEEGDDAADASDFAQEKALDVACDPVSDAILGEPTAAGLHLLNELLEINDSSASAAASPVARPARRRRIVKKATQEQHV